MLPLSPTLMSLKKAGKPASQLSALESCMALSMTDPKSLVQYHDVLLSIIAAPYSMRVYKMANLELGRLTTILESYKANKNWQRILTGSGLPFTKLHCQFSCDIVKWLLQEFNRAITIYDAAAHYETVQQFFQVTLPGIEFHEATQRNLDLWNRIRLLSGHYKNTDALNWLVQLISQQPLNPILKDQLYDRLKIYISWNITEGMFSRSYLRIPVQVIACKKETRKQTNSLLIVKQPVGKAAKPELREKEKLIHIAKTSLALYYRETDPVTYAHPDETMLYDMGNGLQLLLTGMNLERRLSLESYVGYMAFKNGIPVAYGGGWMFGYRCKIGISIYPPFRGVDSDTLFCQVLRLYYQVFKVKCFVVKPYQFGKNNPDGIKSGAFWFYYKLGFRPMNETVISLASAEWDIINTKKGYRTSPEILKRFTTGNLEWQPEGKDEWFADADIVSISISAMIKNSFNGNREAASIASMNAMHQTLGLGKMKFKIEDTYRHWQNWSLLFASLPGSPGWNKKQKDRFLKLLQLKAAGNELEFILAIQKQQYFWLAIKKMFQQTVTNK